MRNLIGIAMLFASLVAANAQDATDYRSVLRACGDQWRASETRKNTPRGEGMVAWQTFRRECVKNSGYVARRASRSN